jgi:hypothetical protein
MGGFRSVELHTSSRKAKPLADTPGGSFFFMANSGSSRPADLTLYARVALPEVEVRVEPPDLDYKRFNRIADDRISAKGPCFGEVASHCCGGELDAVGTMKIWSGGKN